MSKHPVSMSIAATPASSHSAARLRVSVKTASVLQTTPKWDATLLLGDFLACLQKHRMIRNRRKAGATYLAEVPSSRTARLGQDQIP